MGFKLLLVDDEPLVRRGIKQLIDLDKYDISDVRDASDGEEALEIVENFSPNIAILDINMPKMDGITLAKKLREILPNLHIIMLTGYDQYEYTREAIKINVDDYILKPLTKNEIENLLETTTLKLKRFIKEQELVKATKSIDRFNDDVEDATSYKNKIIEIINVEYSSESFNFNELAKKMNLSNGYLSRLFKELFKQTFSEYLTEFRLEHARYLLIGTDLRIYEIAEKCGYSDPNYFSSAFKKLYQLSPNQYREKVVHNNEV